MSEKWETSTPHIVCLWVLKRICSWIWMMFNDTKNQPVWDSYPNFSLNVYYNILLLLLLLFYFYLNVSFINRFAWNKCITILKNLLNRIRKSNKILRAIQYSFFNCLHTFTILWCKNECSLFYNFIISLFKNKTNT